MTRRQVPLADGGEVGARTGGLHAAAQPQVGDVAPDSLSGSRKGAVPAGRVEGDEPQPRPAIAGRGDVSQAQVAEAMKGSGGKAAVGGGTAHDRALGVAPLGGGRRRPPRSKRNMDTRQCGEGVGCWSRPGENRPAPRGRRYASLDTANASDHHAWASQTGRMRVTVAASAWILASTRGMAVKGGFAQRLPETHDWASASTASQPGDAGREKKRGQCALWGDAKRYTSWGP